MYKALGFDEEIALNMALKACMILPGPIVQGGWAVLAKPRKSIPVS